MNKLLKSGTEAKANKSTGFELGLVSIRMDLLPRLADSLPEPEED